MDFPAIISDIKAKLAATNTRLTKLTERRRPYAFDAVTGDAEARKAIAQIDVDAAAARNESETLTAALQEAQRREAEHEARLAAEDRQRREHETKAVCAEILAIDKEFDQAAERLTQTLVRREELVGKVARLGVIYPGMINALRRKSKITSALAHAGLARFVELDLRASSPPDRRPLAHLDASLGNPTMTAEESRESDPASDGIRD